MTGPGLLRRAVLGAAVAVVACAPAGAHAQDGRRADGQGRGAPALFGTSYLAPGIRLTGGRFHADAGALAFSRDGSRPGLGGDARVAVDLVPAAGLSVAAFGSYWGGTAAGDDPLRGAEGGLEVARHGQVDAWASWTELRPGGSARAADAARLGAGASWSVGRLDVGLALARTTFVDSILVRADTVVEVAGYAFRSSRLRTARTDVRYADVEAALGLALGSAWVGVVVGARHGWTHLEGAAWGRVRAAMTLPFDGIRAEAAVGVRPAVPERGMVGARFVSAGLRWTPGSRAAAPAREPPRPVPPPVDPDGARLEVVRMDDGTRALMLRNVAGLAVDVMGDFTDWKPRPATARGPDAWLLRTQLEPGTYGFLVRVDAGIWHVPVGIPSRSGDFGTPVGVLVVPAEGL